MNDKPSVLEKLVSRRNETEELQAPAAGAKACHA
jgi:hypothetical protein